MVHIINKYVTNKNKKLKTPMQLESIRELIKLEMDENIINEVAQLKKADIKLAVDLKKNNVSDKMILGIMKAAESNPHAIELFNLGIPGQHILQCTVLTADHKNYPFNLLKQLFDFNMQPSIIFRTLENHYNIKIACKLKEMEISDDVILLLYDLVKDGVDPKIAESTILNNLQDEMDSKGIKNRKFLQQLLKESLEEFRKNQELGNQSKDKKSKVKPDNDIETQDSQDLEEEDQDAQGELKEVDNEISS